MHLLTQEAMALYLSRLAPHGVMAFHISNRHLNLAPIVGRLAVNNGLTVIPIHDAPSMRRQWASGKAQSTWVMMARVPADLGELTRDPSTKPWVPAATPLWTDDFSNIFDVLDLGLF
jgi:hypothetical protein